jgi:hypothetical protein
MSKWGRGNRLSVECSMRPEDVHKTRKCRHNSRENSDNRPEKLRQVAAAAHPPLPCTIFTSTFTGYSLYFIMDYLRLHVILDEGWIARDSGGSEEPYRHLPEGSEDNQENSVQKCVLNLSLLPMWWMAQWAETCWWGNTQKINCCSWLNLLWLLLSKTQRRRIVLKLSKPIVPTSLSLHTFSEGRVHCFIRLACFWIKRKRTHFI